MNFANVGVSGLILIVIVLVLVFGPSKLPDIGRAFGRSLKEFKDATKGVMDDSTPTQTVKETPQANPVTTAAVVEPIELKEDKPQ